MERHVFLSVLAFTLLALVVGIFVIPGQPPQQNPTDLPWQVQPVGDSVRVFGLTLGKSTLGEAEPRFGAEAEISLFAPTKGAMAVEAFFESVTLAGLRAKLVLTADLTPEQLQGIYNRGTRIATMGSGTRKVTLSADDLALVRATPVGSITYLPRTDINAELVEKRFGVPAQKIREKGDKEQEGAVHWLYPSRGLDIALRDKGQDVLQYLPPAKFNQVMAPLQASGQVVP